ncbi:MAG: tetratricopeptide repeat protein [Devosia sp.]|nr:tetratricopeptide repeat protein [Devosia sp.]
MTSLLRLVIRPVLPAAAVLALILPAVASTTVSTHAPSGYGNYLAGQEALRNLATGDAARYFHDATAVEWGNPTVVTHAFLAYLTNGDIDHAVELANHLLELRPDFTLAKLVVATSDLKDRRYRAVEKLLDNAPADDFAGIGANILKAWAMVGEDRRDDAFAALDKIGNSGLDDFLVFHRALMADVTGDSTDAINFAGKAYQASPTASRMVDAYARMLGNAGRFDDAIAVIDKFNAQSLGDPVIDALRKTLAAHQRPGLFSPNVQSGAAKMFHGIAVALARDGSNDLAIGLLQLGAYLDPHDDVIPLLIGQLLDNAAQHAAANRYYTNIPQTSPMRLVASVRIAQNFDAMGNRPEALRELGDIVAANPTDLDAMTVYAELLRVDKQYDQAAQIYTKAIDGQPAGVRPGEWVLYYERGIAYERSGKWDKAQPDFLKALNLNPDQPQVLNYLGYTWVDKGENLDQALAMIQKAVKATPTDGFIVDSLGWAFFRLGRIDDAVSTLEQAVQLKPNDPQINDHLGDAYWKAGRKLEAHFQWNVAASLDPDDTLKAALIKKQANGLEGSATALTATPAVPTTTIQ